MTDVSEVSRTSREIPSLPAYREAARAWISASLVPKVDDPSGGGLATEPNHVAVHRAVQRTLYDAGYAGITFPPEYGGQGLPPEYESAFKDEASEYVLPNNALVRNTMECNVPTMLVHGQPDFLGSLVPEVLRGEIVICKLFSEPSAGSDLAGVRTRATRDGDRWVVNGQKIWSTYAHLADWGFCLVRTDWDAPKHRGLTWFAFPLSLPGITINQIQRVVAGSAEFCEVFFDDVVIPDLYRIGEVNDGWTVAQTMLVYERGAGRRPVGDQLAGPGPLAPDLVEIAQRLGRADDPLVRQKVAQGHVIDFVTRSLARRIGLAEEAGGMDSGTAAYGKLFRGTYTTVRGRLGFEIGGAAAMTWESGGGQQRTAVDFLNSKVLAIGAGTNEVQRNGISERTLGMPREMTVDTKRPYREVLRAEAEWKAPKL